MTSKSAYKWSSYATKHRNPKYLGGENIVLFTGILLHSLYLSLTIEQELSFSVKCKTPEMRNT